jgi:hypothetical protein
VLGNFILSTSGMAPSQRLQRDGVPEFPDGGRPPASVFRVDANGYGPQHPWVKQTAPGPQSALVVQVTKVHTSWVQALPSTVETQEHPGVPPAQLVLQLVPVPAAHVSVPQVGTQNDLGATQVPFPAQTVPDGQQNAPLGPKQQLVPGAQQTDPVGPWQIREMSPPHLLQACMQDACPGPLVKLVLPQNTAQLLGAASTVSNPVVVARKVPPTVPPMSFNTWRRLAPPARALAS